ncbi:phosphate acetyltransferase, variant [Aphanomyces astaci]|uniref:Phosphate acetyltransferase, variant n=1 Tax=Aphanomyces astaci TaxID=112090 RepID=W4HDT3_APHAT|nr:phosphate acetyltransferase, variant [Aphanomyces astaci]ETV89308.1 phosphate acetyltransferase, variant [Aphanomyces astaci]|eukprot:XP_009821708.1 phosphate acetyltransferase, variant [Aphanomyces astaci]
MSHQFTTKSVASQSTMLRVRPFLSSRKAAITLLPRATTSRFFTDDATKKNDRLLVMTNGGVAKHSHLLLGLMNKLSYTFPSVGYFRPVAPNFHSTHGDHHVDLIRSEFKIKDEPYQLVGMTQADITHAHLEGDTDSVIDTMLSKFEYLREKHDFVVMEGAVLDTSPELSWELNVDIAKSLNAPVLLTVDADDLTVDPALHWTAAESVAWLADQITTRVLLAKDMAHAEGLTHVGTIVNRVKTDDALELRDLVHAQIKARGFDPTKLLGILPLDPVLNSKRLNEVVAQLHAKQLYGNPMSNSVVVTDGLMATTELKDLFKHINKHDDGLLVIVSSERTDVILGLLASRLSGALPQISGIILTNGGIPQNECQDILIGLAQIDKASVPIYSVELDSYRTAIALSKVTCDILPTSQNKIQQAYILFDTNVESDELLSHLIERTGGHGRTPKQFKHFLFEASRKADQHIVLTEGEDDRILQAADEVLRRGIARLTILGDVESINARAKTLRLDLSQATLLDPSKADKLATYADHYFEKRKSKGITPELAKETVGEATYFGTVMVDLDDADGMVSGVCHTTANTIRPALQLIKTRPDIPLVSSVFFMCLEHDVVLYGDCAVNTDPTAQQLAQIAVQSAESAVAFGIEPRVALLSYATGDSNKGPIIDKVREATKLAQSMAPGVSIYGPIQYDAATNPSIAKQKVKGLKQSEMEVAGHANVLVFPDLNTGNNTYKAVRV